LNALRKIGFDIKEDTHNKAHLTINGGIETIRKAYQSSVDETIIDLNESGTSMRFIIALCSVLPYEYRLIGKETLALRPIDELLFALKLIGARIQQTDPLKSIPITITGTNNPQTNTISISETKTSQTLSALLIVSPLLRDGLRIEVEGNIVSKPYVGMTLSMMNEFGVSVKEEDNTYLIPKQSYKSREYHCEGDYSSASYFLGATSIVGGAIKLRGLRKDSIQGDKIILDILCEMGCKVGWVKKDTLRLESDGDLNPIDIDMLNYPDLVPALSVVCAYANGKSVIRNIDHLKYKESNRIKAIQENLSQINIKNQYIDKNLIIYGNDGTNKAQDDTVINTYNDHRIAMSFAMAGLKTSNIIIDKPDCVNKSFPDFWKQLLFII